MSSFTEPLHKELASGFMPTEKKPTRRGRGRPPRDENEFLDAARAVFARKGFDAANMDDIAAAAGSTKPTLYARFGSKDVLYERVVRREADEFIALILAGYEEASGPLEEAIRGQNVIWFGFLSARPEVLQLLFAPDRSPAAQRIADDVEQEIVAGLAANINATLERLGRPAPDQARFLAAMVFGASLHGARDAARGGGLGQEDAIALATSFVAAGYRGLDVSLLQKRPARRSLTRRPSTS
jgi:AcrR family transcriptional regulator